MNWPLLGPDRARRPSTISTVELGAPREASTEIKKLPNRGHSLTIDHGWQEVAQTALDFVKRFVPAKPS